MINYDGRRFRMVSTATGDTEAVAGTVFDYSQQGNVVTCRYAGGSVHVGLMHGHCDADGVLTIRFQHRYTDGRWMSGKGVSKPQVLPDGRIRLLETYEVFDTGDIGESVVEEARDNTP